MEFSQVVGTIAALLTTSAFLPQAIKIIKTKSTNDISLFMYLILSIGILLWLIYGIIIGEFPIIFANSIGFTFTFSILVLKIRYGKKNARN
ncbi:MAG: SemiSWEET transporter [Ignavibacteria bacterium]|nr:SemiSWEET transporter [Ignavibacteria bacterium]